MPAHILYSDPGPIPEGTERRTVNKTVRLFAHERGTPDGLLCLFFLHFDGFPAVVNGEALVRYEFATLDFPQEFFPQALFS